MCRSPERRSLADCRLAGCIDRRLAGCSLVPGCRSRSVRRLGYRSRRLDSDCRHRNRTGQIGCSWIAM